MKKVVIISAILFMGWKADAQPAKGTPPGSPVPFGFSEILIAAGAALGAKKVYARNREKGS